MAEQIIAKQNFILSIAAMCLGLVIEIIRTSNVLGAAAFLDKINPFHMMFFFFLGLLMLLPDLRRYYERKPKDRPTPKKNTFWPFVFFLIAGIVLFTISLSSIASRFAVYILHQFGAPAFLVFFLYFAVSALIIFCLVYAVLFFHLWRDSCDQPAKQRKWFYIMVAIILALVIVGTPMISILFPPPDSILLFTLRSSTNANEVFNIDCGNGEAIAAGMQIPCKGSALNKSLTTVEQVYYLEDGSSSNVTSIASVRIPASARYVVLAVTTAEENGSILWNGEKSLRVPTLTEIEQRKERTLQYILGFLAVICLTVPLMILQIRKVWRDSDD